VPAPQVYRMRRGDCTEHSVLAVALLRRIGIPARAIMGMYLADEFLGKKNVFVYHMWVEAWWKGNWRTVDATRPGVRDLNRYIALAWHNLKAEAPLPYLRAISAIQDLTIEYLGGSLPKAP
jgi:transglutaminase-like putative cysteine protease